MYKDPDKQREANRKAQAKFKAKGVTKQGITLPKKTDLGNTLTDCRGGHTQTDIKCFNDLPPDVQATVNRISESNEEKHKRTQIAIKYQHLFPDRYYSTGAA